MTKERRQFSREFKLMALGRFETAGNVEALADELGIRRELLFQLGQRLQELQPPPRPRVHVQVLEPGELLGDLSVDIGSAACEQNKNV